MGDLVRKGDKGMYRKEGETVSCDTNLQLYRKVGFGSFHTWRERYPYNAI